MENTQNLELFSAIHRETLVFVHRCTSLVGERPHPKLRWIFGKNARDSGNDTWGKALQNNSVGAISKNTFLEFKTFRFNCISTVARGHVEYASFQYNSFWNYSSFIRCRNSERFCFPGNFSALAYRFQPWPIRAVRKCFGQEGQCPIMSESPCAYVFPLSVCLHNMFHIR